MTIDHTPHLAIEPILTSLREALASREPMTHELDLRQMHILSVVNGAVSTKDIAPRVNLPKATVSRIVQRMIALGLLQSRRHYGDERLVEITRTTAGLQLIARLDAAFLNHITEAKAIHG